MISIILWVSLGVLLAVECSLDADPKCPLEPSGQAYSPGYDVDNWYGHIEQAVLHDENHDPDTEEGRASYACALAESLLGPVQGVVIDATDDRYDPTIQVNWSRDCWLRPRCVLQPSNTAQVQLVMEIISRTSARFAVRGGGHNPNRGWASIGDNGVLIDLSQLNKLELNADKSAVTVGAGNRWINVYEQLEGTNRSVIGGRMPDVGVGGLLLGCGIPNFASEFGLACDYVRRVEVVLGNGTLVVADESSNADLWWALKGGGPNFGVVTEFELETVAVGQIWYEARVYPPSENRKLLRAVREYQAAAEDDINASLAFSLSYSHTFVAFVYSKPIERPDVFDMFYDIPFQSSFIESSIGTQYSLVKAFASVLGDGLPTKKDIISVSTRPDLSLYEEGLDRWLENFEAAQSKFDCIMTFGIQPVTSHAARKSNAKDKPLTLVPESQQWYTSVIQWRDDKYDDFAHQTIHASGGAIRELAERKGILLDFEFINDATWDQDPISTYGRKNVERLRDISRRYDPLQVFQDLQWDGFLLRKVSSET